MDSKVLMALAVAVVLAVAAYFVLGPTAESPPPAAPEATTPAPATPEAPK